MQTETQTATPIPDAGELDPAARRLTTLDTAFLALLGLMIAGHVVAALLARGWITAAASRITFKKITDGTSKTYFCGEKSLQPRFYRGGGPTDNGAMFEGHDWDVLRWGGKDGNNTNRTPYTATDMLPLHDQDVPSDDNYGRLNFGSAHQSTCLFVMCDGSVQEISYSIDPATHWKLCNRRDGFSPATVKPFDEFAMLGPADPAAAAAEIAAAVGAPVAIVDANNINVEVLGTSAAFPAARAVVREVLLDNPLGQNDELTPIIVIRPIS
jgi:hypothetical protein